MENTNSTFVFANNFEALTDEQLQEFLGGRWSWGNFGKSVLGGAAGGAAGGGVATVISGGALWPTIGAGAAAGAATGAASYLVSGWWY